jgi:hypothetical protein
MWTQGQTILSNTIGPYANVNNGSHWIVQNNKQAFSISCLNLKMCENKKESVDVSDNLEIYNINSTYDTVRQEHIKKGTHYDRNTF